MIRATAAIVRDSFREAMASRVLWIALGSIFIVLLALSPLGLRTDRSVKLRQHELTDPEAFVRALAAGENEHDTVAANLWSLLTDDQKKRIAEWLDPARPAQVPDLRPGRRSPSLRSQVVKLINSLLENPQTGELPVWSADSMPETLVAGDRDEEFSSGLSDQPVPQSLQNLRRLAAAFPRMILLRDDPAVTITYAGTDIVGPVDAIPSQFERLLDQILIRVLSVFLGFLGVFGALLVTASIIPRTFEPGEISLLLSKPVSRSLLFLTRFAGGCIFTLLCAAMLISGIWLLMGLRLGIWRHELLWCIPVYVFLFGVYYSVSALAGLIWRNSVVALVVVFLFWGLLFTVGATKALLDQHVIQSRRIIEITPAGDELFVVDGTRSVYRWDSSSQQWARVFEQQDSPLPRFMRAMFLSGTRFRPLFDARNDRLLALQRDPSRFGGPAPATVVSGHAENNWERENEGRTPDAVYGLFVDAEQRIILPGPRSIYQFTGLSDRQKQTRQYLGSWLGGIMAPSGRQAFQEISPERMPPLDPAGDATLDAASSALFVFSRGVLHRLDRASDDGYVPGVTRDFQTDAQGVLAGGGGYVLVALSSGHVLAADADRLETIAELRLTEDDQPKVADASADGVYLAILTHAGNVIIFDTQQRQFISWNGEEQGRVSAIAFDQHQLIVANGRRQLKSYDLDARTVSTTRSSPDDWLYRIYDMFILPLHTYLPRPADMDEAVAWLITGERTVVAGGPGDSAANDGRENLQRDRQQLDLVTPFRNNLIFMVLMLIAGCVYVVRRDF